MPTMQRSGLLFAAGGDVLAKYGTLTRRYQIPQLGGEGMKEVFTRAGTAWAVGKNGLLVPYAANVPRVEYAIDPVTLVQQPYLLLEAAGTNLIENSDCEADLVGYALNNGAVITRDNAQALSGSWSCKVVTAALTNSSGVALTPRAGGRFAAVAGTTYTLSGWVFASGAAIGKQLRLEVDWYNGGAFLSANAATLPALVAGWQRCVLTAPAPATTTLGSPFFMTSTAGDPTYTFWLDVPQFEASAFPTSAIPTGVAAVARNNEGCAVPWYLTPTLLAPGEAFWFYYRGIERGSSLSATQFGRVGAIGNYPTGHFGISYGGAGRLAMGHDEAGPVSVSANPVTAAVYGNLFEFLGFAYDDGSVAARAAINGGADVIAARSAALAYGVPQPALGIGSDANGGSPGWNAISRLVVGRGGGTLVQTLSDARAIPV